MIVEIKFEVGVKEKEGLDRAVNEIVYLLECLLEDGHIGSFTSFETKEVK